MLTENYYKKVAVFTLLLLRANQTNNGKKSALPTIQRE